VEKKEKRKGENFMKKNKKTKLLTVAGKNAIFEKCFNNIFPKF